MSRLQKQDVRLLLWRARHTSLCSMQFKTVETILWKVLVRFSIHEYERTMMFHRAPILMNKDCKTSGQRKLGTDRKWGQQRETRWRAPWCKGANTSFLVQTQSKLSYKSVIALVLWLCMWLIIGWLLYEWTMKKETFFRHFSFHHHHQWSSQRL